MAAGAHPGERAAARMPARSGGVGARRMAARLGPHRLSVALGRLRRDRLAAAGYAPLFGVFGMSFVTVSLAGLLWWLARTRKALILAPAVALLAAGEGLRHLQWTQPAGEPVRIAPAAGQRPPGAQVRPEPLRPHARDLRAARRGKQRAPDHPAGDRAAALLRPASTRRYLARLEAAARRNNGDLLVGVPCAARTAHYYNSVISLGTRAAPDLQQVAPGAVRRVHPAGCSAGSTACW